MKQILIGSFFLLANLLFAQIDTVRWVYHSDHTSTRETTNSALENGPFYTTNKYVIVESYDSNRIIRNRKLTINEFYLTGPFISYYPNGKIKENGSYSRISLSDFNHETHKNNKTGVWYKVSETGDTIYKEQWKNGRFVKELIPQPTNSVWNYNFNLTHSNKHALDLNNPLIFNFEPFYQNNQPKNRELIVELILVRGRKRLTKKLLPPITKFYSADLTEWQQTISPKIGDRLLFLIRRHINGTEYEDVLNYMYD